MARFTKEQAAEAIRENAHLPPELNAYYRAILDETLPDYYRKEFTTMRLNYSDEIPPVDVRQLTKEDKQQTQYKCQTNFVASLGRGLGSAIQDEVIADQGLKEEVAKFLKSDLGFQVGDSHNQERIGRINNILDLVIASLTA